jgi:hypothetical protein
MAGQVDRSCTEERGIVRELMATSPGVHGFKSICVWNNAGVRPTLPAARATVVNWITDLSKVSFTRTLVRICMILQYWG